MHKHLIILEGSISHQQLVRQAEVSVSLSDGHVPRLRRRLIESSQNFWMDANSKIESSQNFWMEANSKMDAATFSAPALTARTTSA